MNTRALVTRSNVNNPPEWDPGSAGYIALGSGVGSGPESHQVSRFRGSFREYWWMTAGQRSG